MSSSSFLLFGLSNNFFVHESHWFCNHLASPWSFTNLAINGTQRASSHIAGVLMDSGYYAACAGLAAQTQALDLVANNLANLGTTGYRGQQATFRSLMTGSWMVGLNPLNAAVNDFGVLGGSRVDLTEGSLVATANPLDLAVAGDGFFVVQSAQGLVYTRDGGFHTTSDGLLVTAQGDAVLGQQGSITLPNGAVAVSSDGTISVDGNVIDQLRLAEFSPNTSLDALGNALYAAPDGSALPPASTSIRQGMLEDSNVSPVEGVVQLITIQRNAEMMQRALTLFDTQFNQTAVQDLPRV
jgi:flagellar basal-body rod protein FlgF